MELNRLAPDFELRGLDGRIHRLSDYRGRVVIVNFWSADCPHVERTDNIMLAALARWGEDVELLSIAPNANESVEAFVNASKARGLPIVLRDTKHVVADRYGAQITPEIFVIDRNGILRYRGAVDDVNFRQRNPTRCFFEEAVEAVLVGKIPVEKDIPAFGCAIVRGI